MILASNNYTTVGFNCCYLTFVLVKHWWTLICTKTMLHGMLDDCAVLSVVVLVRVWENFTFLVLVEGGSIAEWLACWTWAQKGPGSNRSHAAVGCLRLTAHSHCASVHQTAKLVAALLRVAGVTAGLAESNGSLPAGLWLASPAGWLPRTGISSGTLRSVIEYGLPLPFLVLVVFNYISISGWVGLLRVSALVFLLSDGYVSASANTQYLTISQIRC